MDVENGSIEESSARIKYLLEREEERDKDDNNLLSPSIGNIPATISSLIPASPYRDYIQLGPLHYSEQEHASKTSDDVKARAMYALFRSLDFPLDEIVTKCVNRVYAKIDRIITCYDESAKTRNYYNFHNNSLPWTMVVDACYILDVIFRSLMIDHHEFDTSTWSYSTVFKSEVSLDEKHDLVRLDNQIPFFVLQEIFECTLLKLQPTTPSLPKLILAFLKEIIPFEPNVQIPDTYDYKHILDLVYQSYMPQDAFSFDRLSRVPTMFSATELAKAGVKFIPNQDRKSELDMQFRSSWGNATLTMPTIRIDESTAPILCNLAAYEQCFPEVGYYVTSYVFAMKMLLDTKEDVLKLVESKVCRNPNGHQYIVELIHGLCKGVVLTDFKYADDWKAMGTYSNGWLGWTRRTYFSGAWSYIASISGLILFVLTAIQTYSSVRTI